MNLVQEIVNTLLEDYEEYIGVDLDGTLAKHLDGDFDKDKIGDPIPAMVEKIEKAIASGKKVKIFTARAAEKENIPPIKAWLEKHDLLDLEVTNEKDPGMTEIWDDRARQVKKDKGVFETEEDFDAKEFMSEFRPVKRWLVYRSDILNAYFRVDFETKDEFIGSQFNVYHKGGRSASPPGPIKKKYFTAWFEADPDEIERLKAAKAIVESDELERIVASAVRVPDGTVCRAQPGLSHEYAVERAYRSGFKDVSKLKSGFVTSTGRFVLRKEARKIAFQAGQIDGDYPPALGSDVFDSLIESADLRPVHGQLVIISQNFITGTKTRRLHAMNSARMLVEALLDDEEKPVIQKDRVVKNGITVCPHCHEEIHEKGYGERDGKTIHRKCSGVLRMPPPSEEIIATVERAWGLKYDRVAGRFESLLQEAPDLATLKANRTTLTKEERSEVMKAKAVWNPGNGGHASSAVWKSTVAGKTWYVCNTHRAYDAAPTLKGAIYAFHNGIEQSS